MNRNLIFLVIFLLTLPIVIIDSLYRISWIIPSEYVIPYAFSMTSVIAFDGMFITYLIVSKGYDRLKKFFFDAPVTAIHMTIDANSTLTKEFVSAYVFSFFVNFFVLYFVSITPLSDIITKIPGFDIPSIHNLNFKLLDLDALGKLGTDVVVFPFFCFGIIILYILKYVRRKPHNVKSKNFPGARVVLGFCYAMIIVMYINGSIEYESVEENQKSFMKSDFYQSVSLSLSFSLLNFLGVVTAVVTDRFLIRPPSQS